jgi:hypothetical protein
VGKTAAKTPEGRTHAVDQVYRFHRGEL